MKTLRQRIAEPHPAENLFPHSIESMSHVEREAELEECEKALGINVWQTTAQKERVSLRRDALLVALEPPPPPFQNAELTRRAGFTLLK